jgi:hypothetical protein
MNEWMPRQEILWGEQWRRLWWCAGWNLSLARLRGKPKRPSQDQKPTGTSTKLLTNSSLAYCCRKIGRGRFDGLSLARSLTVPCTGRTSPAHPHKKVNRLLMYYLLVRIGIFTSRGLTCRILYFRSTML